MLLDTNVLASALGTRGTCLDLLRLVLEEHELPVIAPLLDALGRVLKDKFGVPTAGRAAAAGVFAECATRATPQPLPALECPDPSDVPLLGAPLSAAAGFFVTGDLPLLDMKSRSGIPILPPRAMYER